MTATANARRTTHGSARDSSAAAGSVQSRAGDQALLRRERALPGMATLLEPDAFLPCLRRRFPELDATAVRAEYVRYKPATSCLVRFEVDTPTGRRWAYAKAHRPDNAVKLDNVSRARRDGAACAVIEQLAIAIWLFPYDRALEALPRLLDARARARLTPIANLAASVDASELTPLTYKPERRFVGRLGANAGALAVKAYTAHGFAGALAGARAATAWAASPAAAATLRVAPLRARSRRHHLLFFGWLDGTLLSHHLDAGLPTTEPDLARLHRNLGQALASLHQPVDRSEYRATRRPALQQLPVRAGAPEVQRLTDLTAWLGVLDAEVGAHATMLAARIAPKLELPNAPQVFLHGDFYPKQILVHENGLGLLDFDQAGRGNAAYDLGTFLGYLDYAAVTGQLAPQRANLAGEALLQGYQQAAGRLPEAVGAYTALALLRQAPHPFRSRQPDWPLRTAALLAAAERWLAPTLPEAAPEPA